MKLFIVVFLLLYGGMHTYLFVKVRFASGMGPSAAIAFGLFLLLMVFAPMLVRYAEQSGYQSLARSAAWAGFLWMGWILLFCSFALAHDIYRLFIYLSGRFFHRDLSFLVLSPRLSLGMLLCLSLITTMYGYFEARNIRTEQVRIPTSKLPPGTDRLRIVQISDLHIGLILREAWLKRVADAVRKTEPDILVATGDIVDGQLCAYNGLSAILSEIRPRYGKLAITGNHEFYAGLKDAKCFMEDSGFTLLRGQRLNIGNIITVAGVDDPAARQLKLPPTANEKDLLSDVPAERFRLLLKHRPVVSKEAAGFFDLQLSGHVHKGQIFPFSILTWLYYPVQAGLADIEGKGTLYVSRGTGTWGPPIRVLSPPEVTVIDLVRK